MATCRKQRKHTHCKTIIWNNKDIAQNDKLFFYKTWYEKGIMHLEHFVDYRRKTFYDFETFSNIYDINKNKYLKYYQIIKSISCQKTNKLIKVYTRVYIYI